MGTVYTRFLASGYTVADFRAAYFSLLAEAWGAPTYYNVNANSPFGYTYMEFPDFEGRKLYYEASSANFMALRIAHSSAPSGGSPNYRNFTNLGGIGMNPSTRTAPCYMVAVVGEGYKLIGIKGMESWTNCVQKLYYPPPYWGTNNRAYLTENPNSYVAPSGMNPWGSVNPTTGAVITTGLNINSQPAAYATNLNSVPNKRELELNLPLYVQQAVVGFTPPDFGKVGLNGLTSGAIAMLDAGTDGLYLLLPTPSTTGWCVKVPAAPFSGMTVIPAYVYDMANPPTNDGPPTGPVECEPVRRIAGQIFPDPSALDLQQGT